MPILRYPCLGNEFGPVKEPEGKVWVMGTTAPTPPIRGRTAARSHDAQRGLICTGDPQAGTIPIDNVIGKARFIAWPWSRWGGVSSVTAD